MKGKYEMREITESDIKKCLSRGGAFPQRYAFVLDGQICTWHPEFGLGLQLMEDNQLALACRDYLIANKKEFEGLDQAVATIIAEKWDGWEKLLKPLE